MKRFSRVLILVMAVLAFALAVSVSVALADSLGPGVTAPVASPTP